MCTRTSARLVIAFALAAACAAGLRGRQLFDRPLTDADIRKLIPLLTIDADIHDRARGDAERQAAIDAGRGRARDEALGRVKAGALDPLAWLRNKSPNAVAPSTATYQAACSRELTAARGDVVAVFTFGLEAPASWLAVAGRPAPGHEGAGRSTRARGANPESVAQQARAFYAGKDFEPQEERTAFQWPFLSSDELIVASVYGLNPATGTPGCVKLASGPTVVLSPAPKAFGTAPPAPAPSAGRAATSETLQNGVKEAGLTDADYQRLKFELTMARRDARQPPAVSQGQPSAEQTTRSQNVETYRRFAREIDPLLDRLER